MLQKNPAVPIATSVSFTLNGQQVTGSSDETILETADRLGVGDESRVIVACTTNSDWLQPLAPTPHDYAMKIEGQQPTPAEGTSWGSIRAMYR